MNRPSRGLSTAPRVVIAIVLGMGCAAQLGSGAVALDDVSDETVIGTFDLRPSRGDLRPAAGDRWEIEPDGRDRAGDTAGATRLYDSAIEDLEAGEHQSAQRLFEQIIALSPDSPLAVKARRHLAELYAIQGPAQTPLLTRSTPQPIGSGSELVRQPDHTAPALPRRMTAGDVRWVSPDTELQFITQAGDRVFFSAGSADLGARARAVLAEQARWLKLHPELQLTIEGHADDLPMDPGQHASLGAARAEAVRQRLISEGIEPGRLTTASLGRDRRVAECDRTECAAQNRRVVTRLAEPAPASGAFSLDRQQEQRPIASGRSSWQTR